MEKRKEFTSTDAIVLAAALETFSELTKTSGMISATLNNYAPPRVHLTEKAFQQLFPSYTLSPHPGNYHATSAIGSVEFFCLIDFADLPAWQSPAQPASILQEATA